jgi:nucleoid-associated protein YgaU
VDGAPGTPPTPEDPPATGDVVDGAPGGARTTASAPAAGSPPGTRRTASPATAAAAPAPGQPVVERRGSSTASTAGSTPAQQTPSTVTVRPGDTLWGIAADFLPTGATARDVAIAWPQWYAANRDVIGPDPDLIRPGQRLVRPATTPAPVTTASTDGAGS